MKNVKKGSLIALALALCLILAGAACAETLRPNPATIDMNNLKDRFVWTDIHYKDGKAALELFEYENFPKEAVEGLKAGDVLATDGREITVETAEKDGESGDFYVNKGTENEVLLCLNTQTDCYEVNDPEDDRIPFIKIGEIPDVEFLEYMLFLDGSASAEADPVLLNGADLLKKLQDSGDVGFDFKNVKILYGDYNQPSLIWRYYSVDQ